MIVPSPQPGFITSFIENLNLRDVEKKTCFMV
jgi:hypothetical protein